jgi:hypothetical protein
MSAPHVYDSRASATWWCCSAAASAGMLCGRRFTPPHRRRVRAYMFGIGATEMLGVAVQRDLAARSATIHMQ